MKNNTTYENIFKSLKGKNSLEEILRQGAQKLLAAALNAEVDDYLARFVGVVDESGHRVIVKNGTLPERELTTGIGLVPIKQPRVRNMGNAEENDVEPFVCKLLPKYLRRIPTRVTP